MKIQIDGREIHDFPQWKLDLMLDEEPAATQVDEVERRLRWVLDHKADQVFARFQTRWMEILRDDPTVTQVPTDKQAFFEMVKARPDYENFDQRPKLNGLT